MQNLIVKAQAYTTFMAGATKRKKNTEHTRMYIFFLDFPHHYSQQRSAVRSTAKNNLKQTKHNIGLVTRAYIILVLDTLQYLKN